MASFTSDLACLVASVGTSSFSVLSIPFQSWRPLDRYSRSPPPPSPSDDLRPPSSYRRRGVAVGCRPGKRKAGQDGGGEPSPSRVYYYYESTVRSIHDSGLGAANVTPWPRGRNLCAEAVNNGDVPPEWSFTVAHRVKSLPCAVTGYLWGIWPHRRIVHTFHGISPLCKDIVSPPYVDIEDAFFLPRASPPQHHPDRCFILLLLNTWGFVSLTRRPDHHFRLIWRVTGQAEDRDKDDAHCSRDIERPGDSSGDNRTGVYGRVTELATFPSNGV
ncbi:hypothetical protein EDB83DRAFT_2321611 [Lactarius deliciosus]|nr:hypothetical protein EDB83DRAFT_2321611 [Lactarius deliciosus]